MLTRLTAIIPIVLLCLQAAHAQKEASPVLIKELQAAEAKMFRAMLGGDKDYCRNYLADDYFSINADGSTSTKEQVCADTLHGKFFSQFTYQYFDKKTRVYDNVAVLTGRVQAFLKEALAVEFLYTAVFVNQKGKWLFASWQGTISKDSPKPPSR